MASEKNETASRISGWPLRRRTDEKIIRLKFSTCKFSANNEAFDFKNNS